MLPTSLLCLERNNSQTLKSSTCKKYHGYDLLRWIFFIPCDNWKTFFFIQTCHYPEVSCNRHVAAFFETSVLKEVRILYPLYLHNNIIMLLIPQRSKIKLLLLKHSLQKLYLDIYFLFFQLVNIPHFAL